MNDLLFWAFFDDHPDAWLACVIVRHNVRSWHEGLPPFHAATHRAVVSHVADCAECRADLEESGDLDERLTGEIFDWQAELEHRIRMLEEPSTQDDEKDGHG